MKVLMVLTSHDQLGNTGEKTGFWVEELAAPYYTLRDAGVEVALATPLGGRPPEDPKSAAEDSQSDATRRLADDPEAQEALDTTAKLGDVSADDFDAVFYPGGHGPMWDMPDNPESIALLEDFARADKPVGAVCHGPAALINVRRPDGSYFIEGLRVTGFTDGEEAAVGLTDVVPFLLEDRLKERGGQYSQADDFSPYVLTDGKLVTGQNPASSTPAAQALLDLLRAS